MNQESPNIALSGWVGAGTTSVTVMLALLLKHTFVPATQIFRAVDKKLRETNDFATLSKESEETFQPIVGKTVDNYIDHKLMNDAGIILESDIAAFRIGKHPKVFSIFLKADQKVRMKRTTEEISRKDEAELSERDQAHQKVYSDLWGIDFFDEELINRKYNLVINSSQIDFEQELKIIVEAMKLYPKTKNSYDWEKISVEIPKVIKVYEKSGKDGVMKKLADKGWLMTTQEMMLEITQLFPEDITSYPKELQKVFLNQA